MLQHEELRDAWQDEAQGYAGNARWEEASLSSRAGQKLIQDISGQAPTVGQRLVLALVSLGMLMGMTTLLTILMVKAGIFPFLFVLMLFTAAVVRINVVFHHRA